MEAIGVDFSLRTWVRRTLEATEAGLQEATLGTAALVDDHERPKAAFRARSDLGEHIVFGVPSEEVTPALGIR